MECESLPLSYLEAGSSHDGVPLIVMHGLFGSARNWQGLTKRFGQRHRVYALDMRNHGSAPWADTMEYPEMAADVLAFMNERGIDKAALLGHSMGGKVAMTVALTHPERVAKLVVTDIAPVAYTHTHAPYVKAMKAAQLHGISRRSEVDSQLSHAVPIASLRSFLMQNLVLEEGRFFWRINLDAIGAAMADLIGFPEFTGKTYDGPTLFLGGAASDYITPAQHDAIAAHFPAATITMIAEAGHWVHAERTDSFAAAVEAFL